MSAEGPGRGRRCGVLGSPIAHSLSPTLHQAAYAALGLDWRYTAHEVAADELADFWARLTPDWRGLSLTMPLKRVVVDWCDEVVGVAATLGAVNTVVFEPGRAVGHNTDVGGAAAALREAGVDDLSRVVVVGGGATAASMTAAAALLGADAVTLAARSPERAADAVAAGRASGLAVEVVSLDQVGAVGEADLLVSTIPAAGQAGSAAALARVAPVVFDVVYEPARTPLLEAAAAAGATVVGGFALLLHQAVRQVELMTGVEPGPIELMRVAGLAALARR